MEAVQVHIEDSDKVQPTELDLPSIELIKYIAKQSKHTDHNFIAASIIASRYDDPNVPADIKAILDR